ncbi:hypothetical protein [Cohnella faecalis]|uniref:hypothetical protein n=1 Tax=Cohnella faecalis TaxID=2315694 RepID=UPI001F341680|nr:hypothetical protein [Cohnella faecalis]
MEELHSSNVSHELRHDIETNLRKLTPAFHILVENYNKIYSNLELNRDLTLATAEEFIEILDISEKSPGIPIHWITTENITPLIQQAEKFLAMKKEYEVYQSELVNIYDKEYFILPAENTKSLLSSSVTSIKPSLNADSFSSENDILKFAKSIINELTSFCGKIEDTSTAAESIFEILKIPYKRSISGLETLHTLLGLILLNPRPTEAWFDPVSIMQLRNCQKKQRISTTRSTISRLSLAAVSIMRFLTLITRLCSNVLKLNTHLGSRPLRRAIEQIKNKFVL